MRDDSKRFGEKLAGKVFDQRSRGRPRQNVEVHLSRAFLAELLALTYEEGRKRAETEAEEARKRAEAEAREEAEDLAVERDLYDNR